MLGFSMAEKELIYNMTESMYVCLYLLRSIKDKHWVIEKKPNEPSVFSSYFIKAACKWISEETPAKYDNVLALVAKVIEREIGARRGKVCVYVCTYLCVYLCMYLYKLLRLNNNITVM